LDADRPTKRLPYPVPVASLNDVLKGITRTESEFIEVMMNGLENCPRPEDPELPIEHRGQLVDPGGLS
jgi:hypothetical protein